MRVRVYLSPGSVLWGVVSQVAGLVHSHGKLGVSPSIHAPLVDVRRALDQVLHHKTLHVGLP